MSNVDLDVLGGMSLTMFGTEYQLGDLNVARQDASFAVDAAMERAGTAGERLDGESDEAFENRQRENTRAVMGAMSTFIVAMVDEPGELGAKLSDAIESGKWGLIRLRRAHAAILKHLDAVVESEGNDSPAS